MECLVCGYKGKRFEDSKGGIGYFYCEQCNTVMKEKEGFLDLEAQKMRYDLHENSDDNEEYRGYFERIVEFVLPYVDAKNALDFGCGASNLLAKVLDSKGMTCDSYDPIYHPGTPYRDKRYDMIISIEVFEHLHDPRAVLDELSSLLGSGGYLVIGTAFIPKSLDSFLRWYYRLDPTHIVFFSLRSFEVLAEDFGFELTAHNGKNLLVLQKR